MTRTDHKAKAALMRANPGVWVKVGDYSRRSASTIASNIRLGSQALNRDGGPYAGGGFDAERRNDTQVWARWTA